MAGLPSPKDCPCSRTQLIFCVLLCAVLCAVVIALAVTQAVRIDPSEPEVPPERDQNKIPIEVQVGESFYFTSPNFPHDYAFYEHLEWRFRAPPGGVLTLLCHDVRLSWFTYLYVTDGNITHRLSCYDCSQPLGLSHEFSSAEGTVGLHNSLFSSSPGFNCSMSAVRAAPDCRCGWTQEERIVGGMEATPQGYPWMAGVSLVDSTWVFCGASLISDRHLVTAAHCTQNLTASELAVSIGLHHIEAPPLLRSDVTEMIVHPGFDPDTMENDIAVLGIAPVDFTQHRGVRPICLPSGSGSYTDRLGVVVGWGTTTYEGFMSKVLLEVPQRVISNTQCRRYYGSQIVGSMLCAGGIMGEDACQGDSGGPLFVRSPAGAAEVLGLVSFGLQCAIGWPGVYTRVPSFLEWLEKTISSGLLCPPPPEP